MALNNDLTLDTMLSEFEAHSHEHEITDETSNYKSAQRQTRRQFNHTTTSAGRNVDES